MGITKEVTVELEHEEILDLLDDELESRISPDDVADLSAAVERGDKLEARRLLEKVFQPFSAFTHQVQIGRFRRDARVA